MRLVIIQGQTSTGKTTLAKKLAHDLGIEYFLKDDYKERKYDELGKIPNFWQWQKLESSSWQAMYQAVRGAVANDTSLMIEGNFKGRQKKQLQKLASDQVSVVEIYCYAQPAIIVKRYIERNKQGERHKSHRDNLWVPIVRLEVAFSRLGWRWVRPLRLSDHTLMVDTSDFSTVNYEKIKQYIEHIN